MSAKLLQHPTVSRLVERARAKPLHASGIAVGIVALMTIVSVKAAQHHQQRIAADVTRATDLVQIQDNIEKYFQDHEQLPASVPELEGDANPNPNFVRDAYLFDPETKRPYEYKAINLRSYQLCANFHFSYEKEVNAVPPGVDQDPVWQHTPGRNCFKSFVTRDPKAR